MNSTAQAAASTRSARLAALARPMVAHADAAKAAPTDAEAAPHITAAAEYVAVMIAAGVTLAEFRSALAVHAAGTR